MKINHLIPLLIIFLLPVGTNAGIVYEVIDLDTYGFKASRGYSINSTGQVVGQASSISLLQGVFFDWSKNSTVPLGTLYPGIENDYSEAHSINKYGEIVGFSEYISEDNVRATKFDPTGNGNNIDLGSLGGPASSAWSINKHGQIVGAGRTSDGYDHATLFDPTGSGNNIDLGILPGGTGWSYAFSINDNGLVVGRAQGLEGDHATIFDITGNGNNIDLGSLGRSSEAVATNNHSVIVGCADIVPNVYHACLFDNSGNGNNIDLGQLNDTFFRTYALSINNKNQIVGYAQDEYYDERAVLFDISGNGNNIDLNTLIDPSCGWILERSYGINDMGWITGYGINPHGEVHAYLLIPEPATVLLLGLGGLIIRCRHR